MTVWTNLSARERRLAILTAVALLIVTPIAIAPYLEADSDKDSDPNAGLAQVQNVLGTVEKQLQTNQTLRNRLGNVETRFVSEKKLSTFLIALEEASGKAGLGLKSYSPAVREKAKPLPEVTVQVGYAGNYKSLVKFLDELERLKIPTYVRNLRVGIKDENSGELTGSVKVSSYLVDEPKYIGKKQAGESKEGAGAGAPGKTPEKASQPPLDQPTASGQPENRERPRILGAPGSSGKPGVAHVEAPKQDGERPAGQTNAKEQQMLEKARGLVQTDVVQKGGPSK